MTPALSSSINPGGCVGLSAPTCPGAISDLAGENAGVLLDTRTADSGFFLDFRMITAVYRNPNGTTLDFYYQIENLATADESLVELQMTGFGALPVDAGVRTDSAGPFPTGGSKSPSSVTRSAGGSDIVFSFASDPVIPDSSLFLLPAETARILVLRTQATEYVTGFVGVRGEIAMELAGSFQPVEAVPEPATGLLVALSGLFSLGATRAHRKRLLR